MNSFVEKLLVIDIEASGLSPDSYPIEVGVHNLTDNEKVYASFIKPLESWEHWDYNAEEVHNIPRDIAVSHGKESKEVCKKLNELLAGHTVISDSVAFDGMWLDRLFEDSQIEMKFKLVGVFNIVDPDFYKTLSLKLKNRVAPHRAYADAQQLSLIIKQVLDLQEKINERFNTSSMRYRYK